MWTTGRSRRSFAPGGVPALLAVWALLGPSTSVAAQEVGGRVLERDAEAPLRDAVVRLLDGEDEVDASFVGEEGGYELEAKSAGTYRLEVERIGFRSWRTSPFEIADGEEARRDLRVSLERIPEDELTAIAEVGQCLSDPGETPATERLWGEIRKALERARLTREEGTLRLRVREYEQVLGRSLNVRSEGQNTRWIALRVPYPTAAPEELASLGYVVRDFDGGLTFRAPGDEALLSEGFRSTHCFGVERSKGRIGLTFRPVEDRGVPDVKGVLWVDPESGRLQELAFEYVNADLLVPVLEEGTSEGRIEYREREDGRWLVGRWSILRPLALQGEVVDRERTARSLREVTDVRREGDFDISRYQQVGGEVLEVEEADGASRRAGERRRVTGRGMVQGSVTDSLSRGSAFGGIVELEGTSRVARIDPRGQFGFRGVPAGRYELRCNPSGLGWVLEDGVRAEVEIEPGWPKQVTLATPGPASLRDRLCGEASGGVVIGTLLNGETGKPVSGVRIVLEWEDGEERVTADPEGHLLACGLPLGREITLRVDDEELRQVTLTEDRPLAHVELQRGRTAGGGETPSSGR